MQNLRNREWRSLAMMVMILGSLAFMGPNFLEAAPQSQPQGDAQVLINVNHASLEELQTVRGIGPALAERIISDREENGFFENPDDLARVRGIGGAKLQKIKHQILV